VGWFESSQTSRLRLELTRKRKAIASQIKDLQAELEQQNHEEGSLRQQDELRSQLLHHDRTAMARLRRADITA
jgi:hypothetical protein